MFFVAKKLYDTGEAGRVSASAVRIATAGVAVGIMVMIISICVTVGFQREIKSRVASLVGHVQVLNTQSLYRTHSTSIQITDSLMGELNRLPGVSSVHRFVLCPGMLKTENAFIGLFFRGVEAGFDKSFIAANIVSGRVPSFSSDSISNDSILVSASTASALQVRAGDRVYAYFFDNNLRARRFVVSGIFQTNMADFDSKMCFTSMRTAQQLNRWQKDQFSGGEIILKDFSHVEKVSGQVSSMLSRKQDGYGQYYSSVRVDELFPQIFSWLTLLDTNVVAILILMICVAGVTMISGLLVLILERTRFIGVMKAMGSTNSQLRRIFLYLSSMIVVRGLLLGNVLALFLMALQKWTGLVTLDPASYYISYVPVHFPWTSILIVNIVTFLVCVLSLVVPTLVISHISPAKSIRFE
jgi:lipoprotein-releasing system permease protein